jgi:hypothetical protein
MSIRGMEVVNAFNFVYKMAAIIAPEEPRHTIAICALFSMSDLATFKK